MNILPIVSDQLMLFINENEKSFLKSLLAYLLACTVLGS